tara:strand:- start:124 stop:255 length:132 start_codon:yes stop_codon:yes gene_type:complete
MRLIQNIKKDKRETLRELQRLQAKLERLDEEEREALKKIMEDM